MRDTVNQIVLARRDVASPHWFDRHRRLRLVVLLWVYFSAQMLLVGAAFTCV